MPADRVIDNINPNRLATLATQNYTSHHGLGLRDRRNGDQFSPIKTEADIRSMVRELLDKYLDLYGIIGLGPSPSQDSPYRWDLAYGTRPFERRAPSSH
ncbi:hypothetical protein BOTBODRAFT_35415 [Botryobasidium botryosum FD-172 SS1]|uniref:Uncharacterized protein n=1 Tax=Botryobasidium botryosum (strain FD-172 SS1) TaxID=930990 RepID=A0A067M6H0_BOTB1|nr:hypothetical protein BOTBODRAFT_35415 [Botryobasidium botryosum FD-172 SS1]